MNLIARNFRRTVMAGLLILLSALPLAATSLTGTFKAPDGSMVNGKLIFLLSQPARMNDQSAQIVPLVRIFSVTNGQLESGASVLGNDVLVPAGTYYLVRLVDASNNLLFEQKWSIQGSSLDLGAMTPTTIGVVLPDPLVKNITSQQSVQGPVSFGSSISAFSLTLNGNLNPGTTDTNDLGSGSAAWKEIFARRWGPTVMVGAQGGTVTPPSNAPFLAVESASGGSIAAGTYYCVVTYANRNGETTAGPASSITASGSTNQLLVRLNDYNWATGAYKWRVWCGTAASGPFFLQTPATVSMAIANNGFTRDANGRVTVTTSGNHWTTFLSSYTISGATGCATSPNGTRTISEPPPSAATFVFQQAGTSETCGGAGATVSYVPAIDGTYWYAGNVAAADIVLSSITLSGSQPPTSNTAAIDPIQATLNQTLALSGSTRPQRLGRLQLANTTYTLTTPLICFTCSIEGVGAWFTGASQSSGGTILFSTWSDPGIGTLMLMGQESQVRRVLVIANGATNAIMATMGDHSGNGLLMEGVAARVPASSTNVAAFKAYRMNVSQVWNWNGVTFDGGRHGVWFSNSNISMLNWDGGRVNCGSDNAASAFVHSAGPPDVTRGSKSISDPVSSSVTVYMHRLAFEVCKGVVIDFGGGFLGIYRNTSTADSTPAAGTEANIRLWSDHWSDGATGSGFEMNGSSAGVGSGAYTKGTIYFGPGSNDYVIYGNRIVNSAVAPNSAGVAIDGGGAFARPLFVQDTAGVNCDPAASTGKMSNLGATINIYCLNRQPASGLNWNEFNDRLVISPVAARGNRKTLKATNTTLEFIASDDSTVLGSATNSSGAWSFRGGATFGAGSNPSGSYNMNFPNGFNFGFRNGANNGDVLAFNVDSSNRLGLCQTNCLQTITGAPINSTVSTGTAPLIVASTTEVANLNAQQWHSKVALDFSASLDFSSIAAQSCGELTITVTGAATNNAVAAGWPAALEAGLIGNMRVSAADTVTVRLCNITAGAIDPASRTYSGRVVK